MTAKYFPLEPLSHGEGKTEIGRISDVFLFQITKREGTLLQPVIVTHKPGI